MRRPIIIAALLLSFSTVHSQELIWSIQTDTNTMLEGREILLDDEDNIFVGGSGYENMLLLNIEKDGAIVFMEEELNSSLLQAMVSDDDGKIYQVGVHSDGVNPSDALLKVYYPDGSEYFTQTYDYAASSDKFRDVIVDDNNIYTTGYSYNNMTEQQSLTIKYALDGTPEWVKIYGVNDRHCSNREVLKNNSGEVFTMGTKNHTTPGGTEEILLLRYSATGTLLNDWSFSVPGYAYVSPGVFLIDNEDNIYIGGYASNIIGDDMGFVYKVVNGTIAWAQLINSTGNDVKLFTGDFDSDGNMIFAGMYAETNTMAYFVKISRNGGMLNEGFYSSEYEMNDGILNMCIEDDFIYFNGVSEGVGTGNDMLALKLNSNFDLMWDLRYNSFSNGSDIAMCVKVDSEDNVLLSGYTIDGTGYYCMVWKYSNPLGIAEHTSITQEVDIYPNPAREYIVLPLEDDLEYRISTLSGKEVQKGMTSNTKIDVSKIEAGMYFLQLFDDGKVYFAKFVKQ